MLDHYDFSGQKISAANATLKGAERSNTSNIQCKKKNSRTESKEHLEITGGELKQDEALWLAAGWEPAGSSPLSEITAFVNDPKLSSVKISNK